MTFDFTFSITHFITIIGFASAFAWQWFTLKTETKKAIEDATEAKQKATEAQAKLASLELQILREYTSLSHMQTVENRLSAQIGELTNEIRELRRFLMDKKA